MGKGTLKQIIDSGELAGDDLEAALNALRSRKADGGIARLGFKFGGSSKFLKKINSKMIKKAADDIDEMPRLGRDIHQASADAPERNLEVQHPPVDMRELLAALGDVLRRAEMFEHHQVEMEKLSTRERMSDVLQALRGQQFVPFVSLFKFSEGKLGVVVTFLAIMELIKESLVEIVQSESFGPIHVKARAS